MTDYLGLADGLAADIAAGRLRPDERLIPQREFAYQRHIAVSTANRVYSELVRRGLVAGEVGRGTFVRSVVRGSETPLVEPSDAPVDLEKIFPVLPQHVKIVAAALSRLASSDEFFDALRPSGAGATLEARKTAASFLARGAWVPSADGIVFAGSGRQALAATLTALVKPGGRLGVEAMTYPLVVAAARRFGIELVALPMDAHGVQLNEIARIHEATPLSAVYLQPSLHSPTGITLSVNCREAIGAFLKAKNLIAIEDGVYSFLVDEPPLVSFAPDNVIFVDSLSKRIAPGVTIGIIVAPTRVVGRVSASLRSGGWTATGVPVAIAMQMMAEKMNSKIVKAKRNDARMRQALARTVLKDYAIAGDERAYHFWLPLPSIWRAEAFVSAALRKGISVAPGSAFAADLGQSPNGVRIALAAPPQAVLLSALETLRDLVVAGPEAHGFE